MTIGIGFFPAGFMGAGFGTTDSTANHGLDLQLSNGSLGSGRFIDPVTKDYVLDSNGNFVGCSTAQQLVYLAMMTVKGSSALQSLGNSLFKIKFLGDDTLNQAKDEITRALAYVIDNKLIALNSVSLSREDPSRLRIQVKWTDLQSKIQYTNIA